MTLSERGRRRPRPYPDKRPVAAASRQASDRDCIAVASVCARPPSYSATPRGFECSDRTGRQSQGLKQAQACSQRGF
jgi:hypothetical protein